ncbi:hypothetical protein HYW35_02935 [Candidatus Saccharibacteria bacterium]|nr:hypothetical protein [Candidatus Saccharibacteria bacterium]
MSPVNPQPMPLATAMQPLPKRRKWLAILVSLILILAAGAGVYFWQQQKINDLNNQIMTLKADNYQLRYELTDLRRF